MKRGGQSRAEAVCWQNIGPAPGFPGFRGAEIDGLGAAAGPLSPGARAGGARRRRTIKRSSKGRYGLDRTDWRFGPLLGWGLIWRQLIRCLMSIEVDLSILTA